MITKFDENPSGSKRKSDSTVQGISKEAKEGRRKTDRSRGSQRMGGRKNLE